MSNLEDGIRDLREKNIELAKEVQTWKMLAAQKDKEKLELTKEINELRLKISRLRSCGAAQARKLDAGLQTASEAALSHLVQASGAVARTIELTKQYIQERQELELSSPQWNHISGPGNSSVKKVNEVPPLLLGGQSIQPVVSLSRTMLHNRSFHRSPNQNSGVTHRAVPMHMLQDVYIPLTRIDVADLAANSMDSEENTGNNSAEDLGLDDSAEQSADLHEDESHNMTSVSEFEESRGLDAVAEESYEEEIQTPPRDPTPQTVQTVLENPLEGPSWLLDVPGDTLNVANSSLEPDSTTPCESRNGPACDTSDRAHNEEDNEKENAPLASLAFTPTVRRRKRTSSPPRSSYSPRPPRKHSTGRILKVVVAKMRLSDDDPGGSGDSSPPKRAAPCKSPRRSTIEGNPANPPRRSSILEDRPGNSPRRSTIDGRPESSPLQKNGGTSRLSFDAPSPNGTTDSGVIVCESLTKRSCRREARRVVRSRSNSDSDQSAGEPDTRARRPRGQVSYKEKPLNRKLRR